MKKTCIALAVLLIVCAAVCTACSTPPKNPGDIYDIRTMTESRLDMGNKQADRGSLDEALATLNEALRLAVTADDPGLRIRAELSRSNVLFSLGRGEEASAGWNKALAEAELAGNDELAAVCQVYIGWGKLLSPGGKSSAQAVRETAVQAAGKIKQDRLYVAFAWKVAGLAEKEMGRYAEAESAIQRSLAIHEKDRRFELAAYDWFMIASARSLAGSYAGAQQALEAAIAFDRRVENSWGLAYDWRALGDVHTKAGNREQAGLAYQRAADIFRALGNEAMAEDALSRTENR